MAKIKQSLDFPCAFTVYISELDDLIFQIHNCDDYYEEQVNANEFGRRQRPTNIKLNIIFKIWWFKIILSTSIAGHFDPAEDNF